MQEILLNNNRILQVEVFPAAQKDYSDQIAKIRYKLLKEWATIIIFVMQHPAILYK